MGVGALIHARNDQRIEAVRGRVVDSPGRCSVIIIRCAALSGIPFLCGWFSKDMILEMVLGGVSWVYGVLVLVGAFRRVSYRGRLVWLRVFPPLRGGVMVRRADCKVILARVFVLLVSVLLGGPLLRSWLGVYPSVVVRVFDKVAGLMVIFFGGLFCALWFVDKNRVCPWEEESSLWLDFKSLMWFLPWVSGEIGAYRLDVSTSVFMEVEQGWVEEIGGVGLSNISEVFLKIHHRTQAGGFNISQKLMTIRFLIIRFFYWVL